ncbi:MAG TPA: hypothetical protein VG944_06820 [Fimbriimonas sp.]|nr:hypothetical protein [Fimbriimonas sp.]
MAFATLALAVPMLASAQVRVRAHIGGVTVIAGQHHHYYYHHRYRGHYVRRWVWRRHHRVPIRVWVRF